MAQSYCVSCKCSFGTALRGKKKAMRLKTYQINSDGMLDYFTSCHSGLVEKFNRGPPVPEDILLGKQVCNRCYMAFYRASKLKQKGNIQIERVLALNDLSDTLSDLSLASPVRRKSPTRPTTIIERCPSSDEEPIPSTSAGLEGDLNIPDNQESDVDEEIDTLEEEALALNRGVFNLKKTISSHHHCIFRCANPVSLTTVPLEYRTGTIAHHQLLIPQNSRCCASHLEVSVEDWNTLRCSKELPTANDFNEALSLLSTSYKNQPVGFRFPKPTESSNSFYLQWTGLDSAQFEDLCSKIKIENCNSAKFLIITLIKLRKNFALRDLASLIAVPYSTLREKHIANLKQLHSVFVPNNLGFSHITRTRARVHQTSISEALYGSSGEEVIVVADCTYVYIQKSMNAEFQIDSFTKQKLRNLVKPMLIVMPDGYILDLIPGFKAVDNDAKILKHILTTNLEAKAIFKENDIFVLDRGFRDCVSWLSEQGFRAFIPAFKNPKAKQLTCDQANASRRVTKVRWVVEAVNGALKQRFRIVHHIWQNKNIEHSSYILRICAALHNAYHKRFISDQGHQQDIITRIRSLFGKENKLINIVESEKLNLKTHGVFKVLPMNEVCEYFPEMTNYDIYLFATGTYQLKYCSSYFGHANSKIGGLKYECHDKLDEVDFDKYGIDVAEPILIRVKIPSRHRRSKIFCTYILIDLTQEPEKIIEHCCSCNSGLRTIGTCCHVLTAIWYATVGCQANPQMPAARLSRFLVRIGGNQDIDDADEPDDI